MLKNIYIHPMRTATIIASVLTVIIPMIGVRYPNATYWLEIAQNVAICFAGGVATRNTFTKR